MSLTHRQTWRFLAVVLAVLCLPGIAAAKAGDVALVEAVKDLDAVTARALLEQGADVNASAPDGATALHWAVHRDDLELVSLLIDAGATVAAANRYGVQPLSLAAVNGNAKIIERLLSAGADANASLPEGETALMTAARTGKPDAVRALVAHCADVNARDDEHGQTALMWAAANGHADVIRVLAELGGDVHVRTASPPRPPSRRGLFGEPTADRVHAPDVRGSTRVARCRERPARCRRRCQRYALGRPECPGRGGRQRQLGAGELSTRSGADPNLAGAGWNALHQTVRTRRMNVGFGVPGPIPAGTVDSVDVIRKMLANGVDVNARMTRNGMKDGQRNRLNRLGATAFFLAAKITDVEAMRVLVDAGADPMIPSAENTTPLMVAAGLDIWNPGEDGGSLGGQEEEVLEAVKMCVELGNDVNAVNDLQETALHGAAFRGVNIVAEYLVEQGAKLDAREMNGWTPWAIANGFSYSDFYKAQKHTAELLAQHMKERGLPTGDPVPGSVCFDCLQTRLDQAQAVRDRDERMEAEFAARRLLGSSVEATTWLVRCRGSHGLHRRCAGDAGRADSARHRTERVSVV